MGKNYTDEVAWVLDGVAESISDGKCSNLTPSDKLYEAWATWQEQIAKLLMGCWSRCRAARVLRRR